MLLTLLLLFLKHFLVDWVLQTDSEIRYKGNYGDIKGISHSVKHGVGTALAIYPMYPELALPLATLDTFLHYHIDFSKQYFTRSLNLSHRDKGFWILIGFDQLLHSLTYLTLVTLAQ